jgi:hypothetical protein
MTEIVFSFFRLDRSILLVLRGVRELGGGAKSIPRSHTKSCQDVETLLGSTSRSGSLRDIADDSETGESRASKGRMRGEDSNRRPDISKASPDIQIDSQAHSGRVGMKPEEPPTHQLLSIEI